MTSRQLPTKSHIEFLPELADPYSIDDVETLIKTEFLELFGNWQLLGLADRGVLARQSDQADHVVNHRPACEVNCWDLRQL